MQRKYMKITMLKYKRKSIDYIKKKSRLNNQGWNAAQMVGRVLGWHA